MLPLDSPRWQTLTHAYGPASNIPDLLIQLRHTSTNVQRRQIWRELWSALCHQDTISSASFAAVPHLVDIAATQPIHKRIHYFDLIAMVAVWGRHSSFTPVPPDLSADYEAALTRAATLVMECLQQPWDEELDYQALLGTLAATQGHPITALNIIDDLTHADEIECPACGTTYELSGHKRFRKA
jgi:hypothetical protein